MPTKSALKDSFLADKSDDELVELARRTGNDDGAFEELYRRHENGARNVARHILRSRHDADDVVNEAFAGVISAINHGAGPRSNFRQYLMACVRNSCKSRRWCGRSVSTDPSLLERSGPIFEDPERMSEAGLVASAFSSLAPDWQQTLWLTAVEERPAAEVAEQMGRRPAAVAALAHRAREAFAEAYLAQHQSRSTDPACAKISPKLAHYVRGKSSDVDTILVERHLVACVACSCAVDELRDLNASLRTLTGPAPLVGMGAAAAGAASLAGYLPFAAAGGWSVGAVSGAAVAKIAVLGALLVPAAVVAAHSSSPSGTPGETGNQLSTITVASLGSGDAALGVDTQLRGGETTIPDVTLPGGAVSLDPSGGGAMGGGSETTGATASVPGPVDPISSLLAATGVVDGVAGGQQPGLNLPLLTGLPALPGASSATAGVGLNLPAGGGAKVGAGAGAAGVGVGVDLTLPVLTVPLTVEITVPPISTPSVAVPSLSIADAATPAITTPALNVPAVTLPDVGLPLPQIGVPAIDVSSVAVLPALTLPGISVPGISVPPITVPGLGSLLGG